MPAKPDDIKEPTIHVKWPRGVPLKCPLCNKRVKHLFNDGGRKITMLKKKLWVVTNYYKCINPECKLSKPFCFSSGLALYRKRYGIDVWERIIHFHVKRRFNYQQISWIMEDDWNLSVSERTIKSICEHFARASMERIDLEVLESVKANGKIILSLDGAQPEKGKPGLWIFMDLLTGHVLHAELLDKAPWEALVQVMQRIEEKYGVKIEAVMSDKQGNIVKAVSSFRPGIPHAYCHYHFLSHVAGPISAKDSRLQVELRSGVRNLSVVKTVEKAFAGGRKPPAGSVASVFLPLVLELKRAISCRGDRISTFPGLETFRNLQYLSGRVKEFLPGPSSGIHYRTLERLVSRLDSLLRSSGGLVSDIESLRKDFNELRGILARRDDNPRRVRELVDGWCNKLKKRLQRQGLEHRPSKIKWRRATHDMSLPEAWQQWIRLVRSYSNGLYHGYKFKELGFTNNEMEHRIGRLKARGRGLLGKKNVNSFIMSRGEFFLRLDSIEMDENYIQEVLLMEQRCFSSGGTGTWRLRGLEAFPDWQVREHDGGAIDIFGSLLSGRR